MTGVEVAHGTYTLQVEKIQGAWKVKALALAPKVDTLYLIGRSVRIGRCSSCCHHPSRDQLHPGQSGDRAMARQSSGRMTHIRESRELDVTGLNEAELIERDMRNSTKWVMVSTWLKDSIAWMEAAVLMDDLGRRRAPENEPIDHNRENVAYVATGYAYELLMKSLGKADDTEVKPPSHSVKEVFAKIGEERKQEIRKAMAKHGVEDAESYLSDVDETFCHKDRKYGMIGKDMWSATGGVISDLAGGMWSIDRLARIHQEIVTIGWRALEEWEKIRSKERAAILRVLRGGGAK